MKFLKSSNVVLKTQITNYYYFLNVKFILLNALLLLSLKKNIWNYYKAKQDNINFKICAITYGLPFSQLFSHRLLAPPITYNLRLFFNSSIFSEIF